MADTADRRSEGRVLSTNPEAVANRRRYHERKSQGLCPVTGKPVLNRTYSYSATDDFVTATVRSNTRRFCRESGISVALIETFPKDVRAALKPLTKLLKGARKKTEAAPQKFYKAA